MFWPGKLTVALQDFSVNLPAIPSKNKNSNSCFSNCECKCKCCLGPVQKYINFDEVGSSSCGPVQKMMRFSTEDMLLLLHVAQARENFWTNQYYKVNLQPDYEAISADFNSQDNKSNLGQLEQIIDTITTGYRRAVAKLSRTEAQGALKPKAVAPTHAGVRCDCEDCALLPWRKLQQLEKHQWQHKPNDNWHCSICYRRYFIQHTLLSYVSRRTQRNHIGQLEENVGYKQLIIAQQQQQHQPDEQLMSANVEHLDVQVSNRQYLDYVVESVWKEPSKPRKSCPFFACILCGHIYVYSYSHQLHMRKQHDMKIQSSRRWHCYTCSRIFSTRQVYLKHQRRVRQAYNKLLRKYKCSKCSFYCQLERSLKSHVARVHIRWFTCLICKTPSQSRCCDAHSYNECRVAISRHMEKRRIEQGRPPPPRRVPGPTFCDQCQKECRSPFLLKIHIKRVHLKQADFTCEQCGKSFYAKREVKEHIRKVHTNLKSVYCEPCGITIKIWDNYARHCESERHVEQVKRLAKEQGKEPPNLVAKKQVVKVLYCEPCDQKYVSYATHCKSKKHNRQLAMQQQQKQMQVQEKQE